MNVVHYKNYGKNFIKSQRMSPDSFIQMAMQYAFFKWVIENCQLRHLFSFTLDFSLFADCTMSRALTTKLHKFACSFTVVLRRFARVQMSRLPLQRQCAVHRTRSATRRRFNCFAKLFKRTRIIRWWQWVAKASIDICSVWSWLHAKIIYQFRNYLVTRRIRGAQISGFRRVKWHRLLKPSCAMGQPSMTVMAFVTIHEMMIFCLQCRHSIRHRLRVQKKWDKVWSMHSIRWAKFCRRPANDDWANCRHGKLGSTFCLMFELKMLCESAFEEFYFNFHCCDSFLFASTFYFHCIMRFNNLSNVF